MVLVISLLHRLFLINVFLEFKGVKICRKHTLQDAELVVGELPVLVAIEHYSHLMFLDQVH